MLKQVLIFSVILCCTSTQVMSQIKSLRNYKNRNAVFEKNSKKFEVIPSVKSTQNDILNNICSYLDVYDSLYKERLSPSTFTKIIKPVFMKAVGNSEGIVKTGSALSYVLDKDKSTLSINQAILLKGWNQILNVNFNGTSEGSFLNLVNSTKYNYGLDVSAKLSKLWFSTIYTPKGAMKELDELRNANLYYNLAATYKQITATDTAKVDSLIKDLKPKIAKKFVQDQTEVNYKFYRKLSDSLTRLQDTLTVLRSFYDSYAKKHLEDSIIDKIATFEKEKASINGYGMGWFDYGVGYKLLNNAIFDSTIYKLYKVNQQQFNRVTVSISYNYFHTGKQTLIYFNPGVKLFNSYALENQTLATINITDTTGIQEYSYRAYNNLQNKNLNTAYLTINPFVTFMIFPFKKKEFGLETSAEVKIHDYSAPVYDGRLGFVYSVPDKEDKDKSRTTVGIFLTMTKYDSSIPQTGDYMGIGFRVGLPFSNLFKEPEKK